MCKTILKNGEHALIIQLEKRWRYARYFHSRMNPSSATNKIYYNIFSSIIQHERRYFDIICVCVCFVDNCTVMKILYIVVCIKDTKYCSCCMHSICLIMLMLRYVKDCLKKKKRFWCACYGERKRVRLQWSNRRLWFCCKLDK